MKKLIVAFLVLIPSMSFNRSESSVTVAKTPLPFISYSSNHIDFPAEVKFEDVFNLLDSAFLGTRTFNVLHFGGSHVQGGSIGVRMRELLNQISYGIADERGWLFPFQVGKSNPTQYTRSESTGEWQVQRCASNKDQGHWGMGGIVVSSTTDSSSLKISSWKPDSSNYTGNEVRLFYNMHERSFQPIWRGAVQPFQTTIDSTLGCMIYKFHEDVDTLSWQFIRNDTIQNVIEFQGCQLLNSEHGITYNEIGVNGASTASYLRCQQMETQLHSIAPDLVIFGIGINDAHVPVSDFSSKAFEARYDSLIQRIKKVNPNVRFLFLTNNDTYYKRNTPNRNAEAVRQSMFLLSEKHGAAVWDLFEIMGGLGSIKQWEDTGLAKSDHIHLTRKGYYLQAELLFEAFMQSYGDYLEVKSSLQRTKKSALPH